MPLPTCELTKEPFSDSGPKAPHVFPCHHVYSLSGIQQHHALGCGSSASLVETVSTSAFVQLAASYRGADIACPRCSAVIPASTLNRLPLHKKICSLVRMLNKFRTNASLLSFHSGEDAVVRVEEGHPVYEGSLRTRSHSTVPVHVKVSPLDTPVAASEAWKDLTMLLQVTQAMGKSVVRAVGYIERPRESLSVILEPSEDSVMQLVKDNKLNAEFTMNLAEWTASTFAALHEHHIMHAAFSPAALRISSLSSKHHDSGDAAEGNAGVGSFVSRALPGYGAPPRNTPHGGGASSSEGEELRVMFTDFSAAAALAAPDFKTSNSRVSAPAQGMATFFAAPERQKASGSLHRQSDTWSYAMTMYYLLTGVDPNSIRSMVTEHRYRNLLTGGEHMDMAEKRSGAPRELFQLLSECMHAEPTQRPSMSSIARRIKFIIADGGFENGKFVYKSNAQRREQRTSSGRAQHAGEQNPGPQHGQAADRHAEALRAAQALARSNDARHPPNAQRPSAQHHAPQQHPQYGAPNPPAYQVQVQQQGHPSGYPWQAPDNHGAVHPQRAQPQQQAPGYNQQYQQQQQHPAHYHAQQQQGRTPAYGNEINAAPQQHPSGYGQPGAPAPGQHGYHAPPGHDPRFPPPMHAPQQPPGYSPGYNPSAYNPRQRAM